MANSDGIPPEVLTGLDIALGLPPGTIQLLIDSGLPIFDWLFGGGHAGSCGAFREQYFGVHDQLDPVFDASDQLWGQAGVNEHPTPTEIMAAFSPTVYSALKTADNQFDQFKGSNLLGQTMFASRLHLYLFFRWMGSQTFGIAQWAQIRYLFVQSQIGALFGNIVNLQAFQHDITNRALTWDADHQFVVAIQGEVATLQSQVQQIRLTDIPALQAADAAFASQIQNVIIPSIAAARQLAELDKSIIDTEILPQLKIDEAKVQAIKGRLRAQFNARIHRALQKINDINQQKIPQINEQLQGLQDLVPQILEIPQIQQSLITLGQRMTNQEQQKTQTILPSLAALAQGLAELADQIQNQIIPHQALHDQQITNILNYLTLYVQVNIELLLNQTTDIYNIFNTVVYPQITIFQTFINTIEVTIRQFIRGNCQLVWDCLTRHRKQNPDDACREGQTWWGTWAECWLDVNTPESLSDLTFQSDDLNPDEIVGFMAGAFDEQADSRAFQIVADTVLFLGRAQDESAQADVPFLHVLGEDPFIFQAA